MKHLNVFAALSLAVVFFSGCQPENTQQQPEVNPPVLTPLSEEDLFIPVEGGSAVIAYTLENPVTGGSISASADNNASEWITAIDCQYSGEVRLTAKPNECPLEREGHITVKYSYPDGEPLSFTTKILQAGKDTPDPENYKITVTENPNCTVAVTTGGKEITEAAKGTVIDITATPAEGYTFMKYVTEGITFQDETMASLRFVMPDNDIIIQTVVEDSQSVPHRVKINGGGDGQVTVNVGDKELTDRIVITEAMPGETVTIEVVSTDPLLAFSNWEVKWGGVELEDENSSTTSFIMSTEDVNIDAIFTEVVPDGCLVTVVNPRGGTIKATDAEGNDVNYVVEGTEVFLSIETKTNYTFNSWALIGAAPKDATSTQTSFIMPNNEVTVNAELTYEGGEITEGETVVINGITWATANVDVPGTFAASPQDPGLLFQFNRITGYSTESDVAYGLGGQISFSWNQTGESGDAWDSSNDPCPDGYRVPTSDELKTLSDAANVECVFDGSGMTFTDKNTNQIMFMPGGVERSSNTGKLWHPEWCSYWSATGSSSTLAYRFYADDAFVSVNQSMRASGYFIRCILVK